MQILYIEDDRLTAVNTVDGLHESGLGSVDHHRTWAAAQSALSEQDYDVAVLDVHLRGSTLDGIDIGNIISARHGLPIVVTTSYSDEVTLARLSALPHAQYLLKPFAPSQLVACVQRVVAATPRPQPPAEAGVGGSQLLRRREETRFVNGTRRGFDRIDFAAIAYLRADGAYTEVHLADGQLRTIDRGLRATIEWFGRDDLLQIHRSYSVPFHSIERVDRDEVELRDGRRLPLGRAYRDGIKRALG